jgi:hypothetical protein
VNASFLAPEHEVVIGGSETGYQIRVWPQMFRVLTSRQPQQLVTVDHGWSNGDLVVLREYDPDGNKFTGRIVHRTVQSATLQAAWGRVLVKSVLVPRDA